MAEEGFDAPAVLTCRGSIPPPRRHQTLWTCPRGCHTCGNLPMASSSVAALTGRSKLPMASSSVAALTARSKRRRARAARTRDDLWQRTQGVLNRDVAQEMIDFMDRGGGGGGWIKVWINRLFLGVDPSVDHSADTGGMDVGRMDQRMDQSAVSGLPGWSSFLETMSTNSSPPLLPPPLGPSGAWFRFTDLWVMSPTR